MRIRTEQQEQLSDYMADRFEKKLLAHCKENFPLHFKRLGMKTLQQTIHNGVQAATAYDVISQRDMCYYINMVLMFGSGFDHDPQLPWAAELLNDKSLENHPDRVELVYQKALDYLNKVAGPDNIFITQALEKSSKLSFASLLFPKGESFEKRMALQLQELYPQKYLALADRCIKLLFLHAKKVADNYGLGGGNGQALVILLMFFLGCDFHKDPQLPWAAQILNDEKNFTAGEKAPALFDETMSQLQKWI